MTNLSRKLLFSPLLLVMFSCTEPGETTGVAAATGGAIGAGLGAIVGSQTGNPASGLVIGAVAGASSGALIGNAIEGQQENIRVQDEAIERQERIIAAQRSELQELRRMNQDTPAPRAQLRQEAVLPHREMPPVQPHREIPIQKDLPPPIVAQNNVSQDNLQPSYSERLYGSTAKQESSELTLKEIRPAAVSPQPPKLTDTEECRQAEQEMAKAKFANEVSDRLFHTRRAIRLCPDRPNYHHALGEIYLSLNRVQDAEYEFQEALRYDPGYTPSQESLTQLSNKKYANHEKY